ncbi:MAG: hypothetical protein AB7V43_00440 [Acidimicrobiia bacterium]
MEIARHHRSQEEALEFLPRDDELEQSEDMSVEEEAMHIEERRALNLDLDSVDLTPDLEPTSWYDDEEPEDRGDGAPVIRHRSTTPSLQDLLVSQHYAFDEVSESDVTSSLRVLHSRPTAALRAERDRLRELLPQLRADVLGETSEELAPSDQHQADVGTETYEREKDLSVLAELTARLRDIEEELDRRE